MLKVRILGITISGAAIPIIELELFKGLLLRYREYLLKPGASNTLRRLNNNKGFLL